MRHRAPGRRVSRSPPRRMTSGRNQLFASHLALRLNGSSNNISRTSTKHLAGAWCTSIGAAEMGTIRAPRSPGKAGRAPEVVATGQAQSCDMRGTAWCVSVETRGF